MAHEVDRSRVPRNVEVWLRRFGEVDGKSLGELVKTMNSSGRTRYDFMAGLGAGQQCGAVFRRDATTVQVLPIPRGVFDAELDVHSGREIVSRKVFFRQPLLCCVRVRQVDGLFDFRCAIVHLKSTDSSVRDEEDALREAAATALARWIRDDRAAAGERDYMTLGDMNAEMAEEGLGRSRTRPVWIFFRSGCRSYGEDQALTRVASQRLLDHIVITDEAAVSLPSEDLGEQIIIRSDTRIADWTMELSDHIPVAPRFVLGTDQD